MPQQHHEELIVKIILPDHWRGKVRFMLMNEMRLMGVRVPPGFITDGASTPRIMWSIFPFVGRYFKAAVVHDFLLVEGKGWHVANALFYAALHEQGISWWRREVILFFTRIYGYLQRFKAWIGLGGRHVSK